MSRPRIGILVSGRGSNMMALLDAMAVGSVEATPALVLSNDPEAPALRKAADRGVDARGIDHRLFRRNREAFDSTLLAALRECAVDIVVCAGFMRIMTPVMIAPWAGRMLNIHPSLLPAFRGLDTHTRARAAGCAILGCTVHEVIEDLDAGHILGQAATAVRPGEDIDTLDARIRALEHRLYPAVLDAFLRDPDGLRQTPIALLDHG
ncbi:MAG: phosphoribosylglycinamide formyltransferase [Pseudomonadota bacterium]